MFFILRSHRKDEIGKISTTGTAVSLKFDSFKPLENYMKSVYQKCTDNTKISIRNELKSERKKVSSLKKTSPRTRKENARS